MPAIVASTKNVQKISTSAFSPEENVNNSEVQISKTATEISLIFRGHFNGTAELPKITDPLPTSITVNFRDVTYINSTGVDAGSTG